MLGDYPDAGIGDILGISAEVWVGTADIARAKAFLRQHRDRSEDAAQPEENPLVVCSMYSQPDASPAWMRPCHCEKGDRERGIRIAVVREEVNAA